MYAESFRVGSADVKRIVREVLDATADWKDVATSNGVVVGELDRLVDAFEGMRKRLERLSG